MNCFVDDTRGAALGRIARAHATQDDGLRRRRGEPPRRGVPGRQEPPEVHAMQPPLGEHAAREEADELVKAAAPRAVGEGRVADVPAPCSSRAYTRVS